VLPHILDSRSPLTARHPDDREVLRRGHVDVAPPDRHLVVDPGFVRLTGEPRENGLRPSADTLFRLAARSYGPRVVGVVLSGTLDDGTAGLISIKHHGGVADPDHVVPLEKIPALLAELIEERQSEPVTQSDDAGEAPMDERTVPEERDFLRFRCRVGHAYSTESPLAEQLSLPGGGTEFLDVNLIPLTTDAQTTAVALTFFEVGRFRED